MTKRALILAVVLAILVVVASGTAGASWITHGLPRLGGGGSGPGQASPAPEPTAWAWRSEEHWAVDAMVRDATEMLLAAGGEPVQDYRLDVERQAGHGYTLSLRGPRFPQGLVQPLLLKEQLWNPASLQPWLRSLSAGLGIAASPRPAAEGDLLVQLLSPAPQQLERCQARISEALDHDPRSSLAHEQAAAVLGTFGLYDQAGAFADNRFLLCRLTAHLALAEVLRQDRPDAGPAGRLGDIALLILAGRPREAADRIAAARKPGGTALPAPWCNALDMLARLDWRGGRPGTTPAELLASYSGRAQQQSSQEAWDWLEQTGTDLSPYTGLLARTAFANGFSVELGHLLTEPALEADLQDARTVYELRGPGRTLAGAGLCTALNAVPDRGWSPADRRFQVIGWGLWARRFQANLLQDMMCTIDFDLNKWGVKEASDAFIADIERRFGGLELFPILQKRYAFTKPAVYGPAMLKVAELARKHPERIPDCGFVCVCETTAYGPLPAGLPSYHDWLSIPDLFGTTYNLANRTWEMPETKRLPASDLEQLRQLNPYDGWLRRSWLLARFPGGRPTPEAVEEAFAETKAYSGRLYLEWMISAFDKQDPKALEYLKQMAELDPSEYFTLGERLRQAKRDPEAAEAFLKGFRRSRDRVLAANGVHWLVLYLDLAGRKTEAEAIARECAEVYSFSGLQTMAALREQQGRLEEAESWCRKIDERYEGSSEQLALYKRHENLPACKEKLDRALYKVFPEGLLHYNAASQPPHPRRGVTFATITPAMEKWGLGRQSVVVALDGYRVENQNQYCIIRDFSDSEHMALVVYQDGAYRTLDISPPKRRFGVELRDFTAP